MSEPEGAGVAATGGGGEADPPAVGLAHERGTGTARLWCCPRRSMAQGAGVTDVFISRPCQP